MGAQGFKRADYQISAKPSGTTLRYCGGYSERVQRRGNYPLTVGTHNNYASGRWETRYSYRGHPFSLYLDRMPRIPDKHLNCAIYLYPTEADAYSGKKAGGSGFLVSVPTGPFPKEQVYVYAVTNRHVIEDARSPVVRLNTVAGDFDVLNIPPQFWKSHPDGEDIAVCPLGIRLNRHRAAFVSIDNFVTQGDIETLAIGPGDDVFIIGRFINHEGLQKNQPSARFGNISMMPGDKLRQENGHLQLSYLVEGHSIGGYSGSPVFLYIPPLSVRNPDAKEQPMDFRWQMRLLGVDWGHILDWEPLIVQRPDVRHPENWSVKRNTGMMGVVPAWMLADLLNSEELVKNREIADKQLEEERKQAVGALDAAHEEPGPPEAEERFTQADFEAALRKVSRKLEPEK